MSIWLEIAECEGFLCFALRDSKRYNIPIGTTPQKRSRSSLLAGFIRLCVVLNSGPQSRNFIRQVYAKSSGLADHIALK